MLCHRDDIDSKTLHTVYLSDRVRSRIPYITVSDYLASMSIPIMHMYSINVMHAYLE